MSKLREQFSVNARLREYIERMLGVIIENSPQLLEITMNGALPINSVGMSSTNQRRQSLISSSNETENKSVPPQPLKSTESDSSSISATSKKPADKYCLL